MTISKRIFFTALIMVLFTFTMNSCNRNDDNMEFIPNTPVSLVVNLNLPNYFDLTLPGNFMYFSDGFKGLILYHAYDGEYYAYDRGCPHEPYRDCSQLWMDSTTKMHMFCGGYQQGVFEKCCESRFEIPGGFPVQGPSVRALKSYYVSKQGNSLIISN